MRWGAAPVVPDTLGVQAQPCCALQGPAQRPAACLARRAAGLRAAAGAQPAAHAAAGRWRVRAPPAAGAWAERAVGAQVVNKRSQQDNITNEHGAGLRRLVRGHLLCVCSALACHARSRGFVARTEGWGAETIARGAGLGGAWWGRARWGSIGLSGARCWAQWGSGAILRGAGPRQASRSSRRRASSRRSSRSATSRTRTASWRPSRPRVRRPQPWLAARGRDPAASRSVMWSLPLSRLCHAPLAL